jgi:hypothetical protein
LGSKYISDGRQAFQPKRRKLNMRRSRHLIVSTILGAGILATQLASASAQTCTCPPAQDDSSGAPAGAAAIAVYADEAPPPLPEYDQPPIPADGDVWTPGYWSWNGYEYFWVPGTWVEPPQVGLLWTPGYWAFTGGVYAFHRGYWGERVGFYGGVDYGFGYGGVGFEGGRWDNGRFFYNRAVTNIGPVRITNVFEQQVTVRENSRASFNGGPNGLNVKPTAVELEAQKEKHVAPTRDQLDNARAAGRNESAFVSANKGKPSIAATAKPGQFNGAAVVPAKAAGGPLPPPGAGPGSPGPKGSPTPEATKTPLETKPGGPTPEATKIKPENKLEPLKGEPTKGATPTPEATKVKPDNTLNPPKPGPSSGGFVKPEPTKTPMEMKTERPKPEPTKAEPQIKLEPNKPQPMKSEPPRPPEPRKLEPMGGNPPKVGPQGGPQGGKPERACGRPGEPPCPR